MTEAEKKAEKRRNEERGGFEGRGIMEKVRGRRNARNVERTDDEAAEEKAGGPRDKVRGSRTKDLCRILSIVAGASGFFMAREITNRHYGASPCIVESGLYNVNTIDGEEWRGDVDKERKETKRRSRSFAWWQTVLERTCIHARFRGMYWMKEPSG